MGSSDGQSAAANMEGLSDAEEQKNQRVVELGWGGGPVGTLLCAD